MRFDDFVGGEISHSPSYNEVVLALATSTRLERARGGMGIRSVSAEPVLGDDDGRAHCLVIFLRASRSNRLCLRSADSDHCGLWSVRPSLRLVAQPAPSAVA